MQKILLTIVFNNQRNEGDTAMKALQELLTGKIICIAYEDYEKIPGCMKGVFEITTQTDSEAAFNYQLLTLSSSIVRPWWIYFQNDYRTELIFNKTAASSYNNPAFSCIIWAHLHLTD